MGPAIALHLKELVNMDFTKLSLAFLIFGLISGSTAGPVPKPTAWDIFNMTDPGPEYWLAQERQNANRSLTWARYLQNDIEIPPGQTRQGVPRAEWRWSNGIIPVQIDPYWGWAAKNNIVKGLDYLQSNTCIRFENYNWWNPAHRNFVRVEPDARNAGCRATVGLQSSGSQWVKLGNNEHCLSPGTVAHEFIHVAGFLHEQQRPDRDDWVTINFQNIPQARWSDFEKLDELSIFTPYDYGSIMHYPANGAAIDPNQPTIISKTSTPVAGQEDHLTEYDILKINSMYEGSCQ